MLNSLLEKLAVVDTFVWGPWTMWFLAGVAVYFTVRSGFFQIAGLSYIARNTLGRLKPGSTTVKGQLMTPVQAAATSLAGTVGMGNMAGVATALSVGGPGAIFWMWLLAFFGMMSKTAEITLGVYYRERGPDGQLRGGPQYTIQRGLGWTPLALLFSTGMLINAVFAASMLQAHTVGRALLASYSLDPYLATGSMAVITAIVVLGGVRRIGRFSERLVPIMTMAYLAGGLVVIAVNFEALPAVLSSIFSHAFSATAGAGGAAGIAVSTAIKQGMARGMLSNEAGMGTAPMVHATAQTCHPFQQGVWGAFEVFFDTILICSITALAILSTGAMDGGESGIELLLVAFAEVFPFSVASIIVSGSIATFCLSTQIGFYVYFETCLVNLVGVRPIRVLRWLYFVPGIVVAGVADVDRLWVVANIAVAAVAIPNLVAMLCLSGVFRTLMRDEISGERAYATANVDDTDPVLRGIGATRPDA
jgi:AGCS family alanine or glycine:cation symporter|tara:strand:+ start:1370 stop:2797 length:1428 start_codon:yes stop_codon:yes gene_type:complete